MTKIELWQEGFATNGERSKANKIGEYMAENFDEAIKQYMVENPNIKIDKYGSGSGNYSNWGMSIYDNEEQARKHFG
jgi:hypothetical protein